MRASSLPPPYWAEACRDLSGRDRILAALIQSHDGHLQCRGHAFETLTRSIVGQQISVSAAQSVWDRLRVRTGRVTAARVAAMAERELRHCGLSRNKARYLRELADGFVAGAIRPRRWRNMTDDDIVAELTEFSGIGRWTAEMFLIFHLLRPNVLPAADLGLRKGVERHYGASYTRVEGIQHLRNRWRPWCTVATWYLWRSLDPKPVSY